MLQITNGCRIFLERFSKNARPHPGPLLRGEGELFAVLMKTRATDFVERL